MINGVEYGYIDINVLMLGKPVMGCIAVKYKTEQEKKNIYGRGKNPIARGRGQKKYEGSITVLQSEFEALIRRANGNVPSGGNRDITNIGMFDVVITYAQEEGGVVVTDVLKDCEFTGAEKGSKAGDTNMEIELPLILGNIQYNA